MANRPFTRGVHDLGRGCYAYVQPDGSWGWNNAGLLESQGETLLIDTLMSLPLTREMLDDFVRMVPAARKIGKVVNTHANADHFFGNQLLAGAEFVATKETAAEMAAFSPSIVHNMKGDWKELGDGGEFFFETMGRKFDFSGICVPPVDTTFEHRLSLEVGEKRVELIDLGPAHTTSDVIAYVPADRVVYTGDLLFNEGTPIMWAGPIENWIKACEVILGLDVETVVPGHGPITDKTAVRNLKSYFEYVRAEARARFDAGLSFEEAARDIQLREFRNWSDSERIVTNVFFLYRGFGADLDGADLLSQFGAMNRFLKARNLHGPARS